jgi:hypothetical protein
VVGNRDYKEDYITFKADGFEFGSNKWPLAAVVGANIAEVGKEITLIKDDSEVLQSFFGVIGFFSRIQG